MSRISRSHRQERSQRLLADSNDLLGNRYGSLATPKSYIHMLPAGARPQASLVSQPLSAVFQCLAR